VVVLAFGALLAAAPAASAATACTRWASARGSDRARGTAAHPFRTVHRLLSAVPGGGVGCLVPGSKFNERVWVVRPVTLTAPRGRAEIVGGIVIAKDVEGAVVSRLRIRGSGFGRAAVDIRGSGTRIAGNDITGLGFNDQTTPCILLDGVRKVVVDGNRIHNCTRASTSNLYAPGIFVRSALRARITNNVIFHTLGDGIALSPNAQRTRVARNLLDGNVSGIYIGGDAQRASNYNVVTRNIISNSGRWSVHSGWAGPVGTGNIVTSNCVWNGFAGKFAGGGFTQFGNIAARPLYRHRPNDYTLTGGRCVSMHPSIVALDLPRLGRFSVAYELRALPTRVQVVGLTLKNLAPRSTVSLRCTAGCGTHWVGRPLGPSFSLPVLRGTWLPRGAAIEVREQKAGWVGHVARIVVTGLPAGVRIEHRRA
jgi:nitrous oxidase accessory protein NosD